MKLFRIIVVAELMEVVYVKHLHQYPLVTDLGCAIVWDTLLDPVKAGYWSPFAYQCESFNTDI